MDTWTIDDMLALRPCPYYDRERLEGLWAGRERLSLLDILDLDIPPADRVWVVCQSSLAIPFAHRVADRVVRVHALEHSATREWAERWLSGEDRTADAAAAAASEAAAAAWASAWASEAAAAAADAASDAAERERQIQDAREILAEQEVHP